MLEIAYKLEEITPSLNLEYIQVGKRYQFHGDINRVREVLSKEDEYILIRTIGCTEDTELYSIHYSQLKINETGLDELK